MFDTIIQYNIRKSKIVERSLLEGGEAVDICTCYVVDLKRQLDAVPDKMSQERKKPGDRNLWIGVYLCCMECIGLIEKTGAFTHLFRKHVLHFRQ